MSNFVPLILQKNENIIKWTKAKKRLHRSNKYASHEHIHDQSKIKCTGYFYWDRKIASQAKPKYEEWLFVGLCNFLNKLT